MKLYSLRLSFIPVLVLAGVLPLAAQTYRFKEGNVAKDFSVSEGELVIRVGKPQLPSAEAVIRAALPDARILAGKDQEFLVAVDRQDVRRLTAKDSFLRGSFGIEGVYLAMQEVIPSRPPKRGVSASATVPDRMKNLRALADRIAVKIENGTTIGAVTSLTRASASRDSGVPGWWILTYDSPIEALEAARWIGATLGLEAAPLFGRVAYKRMIPNDPLFSSLWQLSDDTYGINIKNTWDTYRGAGINIAVIDEGVDLAHPDLAANTYSVASGYNHDFNGGDNDPTPASTDPHGTEVAGLAAASGNNGVGVVGAAFESKIIGLRLIAGLFTDLDEQQAFTWMPGLVQVLNNSWGPSDDGRTLEGPGPLAAAGLASAATTGRGGKGSVNIWVGGNGRLAYDDSNFDGYANSRYVVTVGAVTDAGAQASYSEPGANIAFSVPSGVTSTDISGAAGEAAGDYASGLHGTSFSAPTAAGAAALLLQANPNLGYRDVKEIFMRSADRNVIGDDTFATNSAGLPFNHSVGAGRLNVGAAMALAGTWINLGPETSVSSTLSAINAPIPDESNTGVTRSFNMAGLSSLRVEHVELTVNATHPYRGDLNFEITSPSGMKSLVLGRNDPFDNFNNWTFMSVRHWGESSAGTWMVKVWDDQPADTGILNSLTLRIYGTSLNPVPAITSLSPSGATVGSAGFTLNVYGSGFISTSVVRWGGANRATTYVNSGQLQISVSAADVATAGTVQVSVSNPGSGVSGNSPFVINSSNPVPAITSLSPSSRAAGSAGFTLDVYGSGFVGASVVRWGGANRATTYVNSGQLQIAVAAADVATAGTVQVSVSNPAPGGGASANSPFTITTNQALQFVPITPCRIMDTRSNGSFSGQFGPPSLAGGATRSVAVPAGSCNIPAGAAAYSLNVTVVPLAGTLGYLTVWPTGQTRPNASTLNSPDGSVLANAAIVPAGTSGAISFYALQNTDVVVDINGYFLPPTASTLQFFPLTPCRVIDTRNANGSLGGPVLAAGVSRDFPVRSSACGIPATAQAYSFNVTVVPRGFLGFLTSYPTGQPNPGVSTLNSLDGTVLANAALLPAGTNGSVSFFPMNTTDLVVDVNGYFAPPAIGGLDFFTLTPCRTVDTRNANGTLGGPIINGGATRAFPLPTASCGLPATAGAYSLNVTVQPSGSLGYLTAWPTGQTQPLASTLNAPKGLVMANAAIVPAGTSGSISIFAFNPTHVILDVNGYFGQSVHY